MVVSRADNRAGWVQARESKANFVKVLAGYRLVAELWPVGFVLGRARIDACDSYFGNFFRVIAAIFAVVDPQRACTRVNRELRRPNAPPDDFPTLSAPDRLAQNRKRFNDIKALVVFKDRVSIHLDERTLRFNCARLLKNP